MNRKKRTRNSRKGSPLSVDLRDFLMYSNPSRFAPKVRKNGGAYPQAPTMDQFFSYGAPTPPTPFVFQNGGMNDIQRTNMMNAQHYGMMQEGGSSTDFNEGPGNKTADFLRRVKEKAMAAVEKEMDDEAAMYEEEAMNFFQYGGMMQPMPDFSKANPWMQAYKDGAVDTGKLTDNFLTLAEEYTNSPTDYYVKKTKFKQVPVAQVGLNFRDQATLPFDYSSTAGPMSGMMYGVNATNPQVYGNVITDAIPGAGVATINSYGIAEGMGRDRNSIPLEDPYAGEDQYIEYPLPNKIMTRDENLNYQRAQRGTLEGKTMLPAATPETDGVQRVYDSNSRNRIKNASFLPEGEEYLPTPEGEEVEREFDSSIVDPIPYRTPDPTANNRMKGKEPGKLTVSSGAASIVEKTIDDIKKKREEEAKQKEEESGCPGGNCGKPGSGNEPPEGTEIVTNEDGTQSSISPEEAARRREAAAANMTPAEYRTFLSRASMRNRRALLPGNRLKSVDFYFDTYGPAGNRMTPSGSMSDEEGTMRGSGRGLGAFVRGARRNNEENFNMGENYTQEGSRISDRGFARQSDIPMKSTYDPRGYNNAYSEFRNQNFQNRRRSLGQKIDELYQRQGNLADRYGQGLTQREADRLARLENRYNRVGTGRPVPGMMGPSNIEAFGDYTQPEYRAYGGRINYMQDGGEEDPFGTSGYSTDGYDTTQREDYAGNTIYEDAPEGIDGLEDMEFKGRTRMRNKIGSYNPYEAPLMLAGLNLASGIVGNFQNRKRQKDLFGKMSADQVFTPTNDKDRGNDTVNEGYFKPPQQVPVENKGYNFQSQYAKMGGSYKKGGEYYLTDEEIERLISMGGEVEFLD